MHPIKRLNGYFVDTNRNRAGVGGASRTMPDVDAPPPQPPDASLPPPVVTAPARPSSRLRWLLWPNWQHRKGLLRAEAWVVVIGSYVLLAIAYLWPQDWRNDSTAYLIGAWLASIVRALQFHLGLLLLVIALAAAFGRGRRLFLATLPPMLFLLLPVLWQCFPKAPPPAIDPDIPALRVMSANLHMDNPQHAPMIDVIRSADPDVLLLQEYTSAWHRDLRKALEAEYPYTRFDPRDGSFGEAIYSRVPLSTEAPFILTFAGGESPQARAIVRLGGHPLVLYNLHLLPPRTLEYVADGRVEFADLLDHLSREKSPVLIAGDLNLTETSPQHAALLRRGFQDAWPLAAHGRGATWPENSIFHYLPGLRLDQIYLDRRLTCSHIQTVMLPGSDHRGIIAEVGMRVRGDSESSSQ